MKHTLIRAYKKIFVRKRFFRLHRYMFLVALWGLGILNSEDQRVSGEEFFLNRLARKSTNLLVLDVGANIGQYSNRVKELANNAVIYAFEPHPMTFQSLQLQADKHGYTALPLGCSNIEGPAILYDYPGAASTHASMYKDVVKGLRASSLSAWEIELTTVDRFVEQENIDRINLLKIDTEGNEFKVLQGAKESIERGLIDLIHFEFNEMNSMSRVFFRDFLTYLSQYTLSRMLPDGLVRLDLKYAFLHEIFAYQNIIAAHNDIELDTWL